MCKDNGRHEQITGVFWYKDNDLHRIDGPAVERPNGTKEWWQYNQLHREDGPAIEWKNGTKYWYLNGNLHREDGPAVEKAEGTRFWYVFGRRVTELEFQQWKSKKELKYKLDCIDFKPIVRRPKI